jgi:hypothetical protein
MRFIYCVFELLILDISFQGRSKSQEIVTV